MKVYVATSGSYSDYHIVGIFSSEEKVIAFGYKRFEEYDVDMTDQHPGCRWYQVEIALPTGEIDNLYESDLRISNETIVNDNIVLWILDRPEFPKHWGRPIYKEENPRVLAPGLQIYCWATDEEQVRKIAGDKRKEYLATHPDVRRIEPEKEAAEG